MAVAATTVGELVAKGKVDWDTTPASHYLPEFLLKDLGLTSQLTFADLLSHRTPWRKAIKRLRYLDMPSKLLREVNYHNTMYAIAGEAAANVAGLTYAELIQAKIFDPLELKDTGLSLPEMAKRPNFAMPYYAASFEDAKNGIYEEGYMDPILMSDALAGDIYMNVVDLAKWNRVILKEGELDGKQVLNKESVQETWKPHNIYSTKAHQPGFAPTIRYGLGWGLDSYKGHAIMHH
ncbi:hypothetical protein BG015_011477, partial [Linnemannia schmuckeri]